MMKSNRICLGILVLAAVSVLSGAASAQPMLGEVRIFAGNFPPRGWAFCDGQLLAINSNQSLFSLLGTTYGGDGRTTFGLPDLRGRSPVHPNLGDGKSDLHVAAGARFGTPTMTLTPVTMPSHTHSGPVSKPQVLGSSEGAGVDSPEGAFIPTSEENNYSTNGTPVPMAAGAVTAAISNTGGGMSFSNSPPTLAINYVIALQGLFPSRN